MFGMLVLPVLVTAVVTNVVTVKDGRLSTGRWVGTYTSQLQENVLSAMFPAVQPVEYTNRSLIDDTLLRYLYLEGSYHADTPLRLPSLCVLSLNGTLGTAKNLTFHNISRFTGLVQLNDTHFSAVLGGTYDASSVPESAYDYPYSRGYMAIAIQGGSGNAVRGVRALANNSDGAIGITGSPNTEIAESNIGGPGRMTRGRCIWCLSTSRAIIHDNHVHHCSAHALDFDAYTSRSTAYSNLCEDNGEEGIFVEETASDNFIFNNTCALSYALCIVLYQASDLSIASGQPYPSSVLTVEVSPSLLFALLPA